MPWKLIAPMALAGSAAVLMLPAAVLAPASAAPQQQAERGNDTLKKYCTGDYLSYCGQYNRDDPRLDQCFQANWKKLSENCRRAIDAYAPGDTPSSRKRG